MEVAVVRDNVGDNGIVGSINAQAVYGVSDVRDPELNKKNGILKKMWESITFWATLRLGLKCTISPMFCAI